MSRDEIINAKEVSEEIVISELSYAKEYFNGLWGDYGRTKYYWKIICEYIKMLEKKVTP